MKKLTPFLLIFSLTSCASIQKTFSEDEPLKADPELVKAIINKAQEITGFKESLDPEINFLEEDFYQGLINNDCNLNPKTDSPECQKIAERTQIILGKSAEELYGKYLPGEYSLKNKDCNLYDNLEKGKCEENKEAIQKRNNIGVWGRAFMIDNRIEIFPKEIQKFKSNYLFELNSKERKAILHNSIAHEILHILLNLSGSDADEHHQIMKNQGYLETLIDLISERQGLKKNGKHKKISLAALDSGIESDNIEKDLKRKNSLNQKKAETNHSIHCGIIK